MQPDHIRLVWLTMLALADWNGVVQASLPGLAHVARVPLNRTQEAVDVLSSPDPYSRTPDHEGRRIEPVPGGWRILNYAKYRGEGGRQEYERLRKAAQRSAKKLVPDKSGTSPGQSPHTDTDLDKTSSSDDDPGYQALLNARRAGSEVPSPGGLVGTARDDGNHVTTKELQELEARVAAQLQAERQDREDKAAESDRRKAERDQLAEAHELEKRRLADRNFASKPLREVLAGFKGAVRERIKQSWINTRLELEMPIEDAEDVE